MSTTYDIAGAEKALANAEAKRDACRAMRDALAPVLVEFSLKSDATLAQKEALATVKHAYRGICSDIDRYVEDAYAESAFLAALRNGVAA